MMWVRESPASLGPSPIGKRTLVASVMRSRRPLIALPTISSEAPCGVHVGGVDELDARVEREVDLAARGLHVELTDVGELPGAAETHRAETQRGDPQS